MPLRPGAAVGRGSCGPESTGHWRGRGRHWHGHAPIDKDLPVTNIESLPGVLVLTRFVATLLLGDASTDPLKFSFVALLLAFVALVAAYVPARQACASVPWRPCVVSKSELE